MDESDHSPLGDTRPLAVTQATYSDRPALWRAGSIRILHLDRSEAAYACQT